ncbi:MAG: hypothetical protein AB2385_02565 [Symbiobacterium sp.]|uniref:hypothetical protein n=1 Tax=Symbiobacterium sp. TaxID=1971213 RepID=UPI003464E576
MEGGSWRWDLVGLRWTEAEPILIARGLSYTWKITAPPGRPVGIGELRVVAQRETPAGLTLVLAHREYARGEQAPGQGGRGGAC